jgi:hypothetical protein
MGKELMKIQYNKPLAISYRPTEEEPLFAHRVA